MHFVSWFWGDEYSPLALTAHAYCARRQIYSMTITVGKENGYAKP